MNDEIKKMGKMFDNNGRTPFHYCATKFNEFCQTNKVYFIFIDKNKNLFSSLHKVQIN
jgi:hypothetical protein